MASDLPVETLLRLVIEDFETAWNAVADLPDPAAARGNFMFGKQAMVLLELAARACKSDPTGAAIVDFAAKLRTREPRYFQQLPGVVWTPSKKTRKDFELPSSPGIDPCSHLLAAVFNLVRNGQVHQYQQMRAVLPDTTYFCVQLTGAQQGLRLPRGSIDRRERLSYWIDGNDLWLKVRPDVLFVDLRDAARAARLEQRGLTLTYLGPVAFPFTREALGEALDNMRS